MAAAIITAPLDVLRTRLQADFYRASGSSAETARSSIHPQYTSSRTYFQPFRETICILSSMRRLEGWRGYFRGLGPSITGIVPANAIKFYVYGNCKQLACQRWGFNPDNASVHALSACVAGTAVVIATNPIWVVKTRLQLDKKRAEYAGGQLRNSIHYASFIIQREGVKGLYRGLSASMLGVAETALHLTCYEWWKIQMRQIEEAQYQESQTKGFSNMIKGGMGMSGAAGVSKFLTALIAYPHEVSPPAPAAICFQTIDLLSR